MASNLQTDLSLTTASSLFKIKFNKPSDNTYNDANILLGRSKRNSNFTGKRIEFPAPLGFAGSTSWGSFPETSEATYVTVTITAKKLYASCRIDRESLKASLSSEGAFVSFLKEPIQKTVESGTRNLALMMFGDGTGALGTSASTSGTAPYVQIISAATWKESAWEENDFVNVDSGTDLFQIVAVVPSTRAVSLTRQSGGSNTPGSSSVIYLQKSKNNVITGLKGSLDATSSTMYGVTVGRRWQAYQDAAGGVGVTVDRLNKAMLQIEKRCGKVPNMILASFTQYEQIIDQLEDQKRYTLAPKSKAYTGNLSFDGVEYMSSKGSIGIFPERFCEDDRVYLLNDNYMEIHQRPDFGWFDDDGSVFLRDSSGLDSYQAYWGGYLEFYAPPPFAGEITGLATT